MVIDAAALEAEPQIKVVTTFDLTASPAPAPLGGSPTEDAGPSDDENPAPDPLGPAAVAATTAAKRAKTSVVTAPAGDITKGREDVDEMKAYD